MVYLDPDYLPKAPHWSYTGDLRTGESLTLSPSIACGMVWDGVKCGAHGFIRDGRWVEA